MRIQTEYMCLKNHWTLSSSHDFQAHQRCSQRSGCFSQSALLRYKVLAGLLPALAGAPRHLVSAPRLVTGSPRCSQVHLKATASVQYTLGFDHPGIVVRQLSDTPSDLSTFCWWIWHQKGRVGNSTWQTGLSPLVRSSKKHWTSYWWLAIAERTIESMESQLRSGISSMLVWISLPRCFFCSSWWCADSEDDKEETSGHRSCLITLRFHALTDFHVAPCSFTITYVNPEIAG